MIGKKSKTFIVLQMQVDRQEESHRDTDIFMSTIVRQVVADTKESAIGKFVVATQKIEAKKKLQIECYSLEELTKIK